MKEMLTFWAVLRSPPGLANDLAGRGTGVVPESIVPRPAQDFAARTIVVRCALHPVGDLQMGAPHSPPPLLLLDPRASDISDALLRHPRDQRIWNNKQHPLRSHEEIPTLNLTQQDLKSVKLIKPKSYDQKADRNLVRITTRLNSIKKT